MSPSYTSIWRSISVRHLFVGLCVIAHLTATIGLPLPQLVEIEAGSTPFPCQHHHCGCQSADHCWRSCCCMSMREKLAWAKQHGVTPPDYVLAAAEAEDVAAAAEEALAESGSCCHRSDATHCCQAQESQVRGTCCASHAADGMPSRAPATEEKSTSGWEWVVGIQARKCQGLSTLWIVCGAALPPPEPLAAPIDSAPPLWWSDFFACHWQAVPAPPDVPPPQPV